MRGHACHPMWLLHARSQLITLQHTALQCYSAIPTAASVPPHCTSLLRTNSARTAHEQPHTHLPPQHYLHRAMTSSTCTNASCSFPNRRRTQRPPLHVNGIGSICHWRGEASPLRARRARRARQPGPPRRPWPRCSGPRPRRVRALGPIPLAPPRRTCRRRVRTAPPQPQEPRPAGPRAHQGPPPAPGPFDEAARLQRRPSAPAPHGLVREAPQARWAAAAARQAAGPLPECWPTVISAVRVRTHAAHLRTRPSPRRSGTAQRAPPPLKL